MLKAAKASFADVCWCAGQPLKKKPIVTTQFVEWASSRFARPESGNSWRDDCESRPHHERVWRYARNRSLRNDANGRPAAAARPNS